MRVKTPIFLVFAASLACPKASDSWNAFLGTWEFRERNSASATGYDPEGERLEIERRGDSVVARYFGLERMGDEGLYYTAVEVKELKLTKRGQLSFVVPERFLFHKRPANLNEAKALEGHAGITRYELRMTGTVIKGNLELACSSEFSECPDGHLVFKKSAWK